MGCLKCTTILVAFSAVGLAVVSKIAKTPLPIHPVDLTGKNIIVTGSSDGIGKETARILAGWNATVIMACRNEAKAQKVADDIKKTAGSDLVSVIKLDLSSFKSVKAFAKQITNLDIHIHGLINNAGLLSTEKALTEDGHELTYQTNHLGHFLLTKLLLPRLKASKHPVRVIQVSSEAHYWGKIDLENLDAEKVYATPMQVYGNSKLMNVLFANELNKRYKHLGIYSTSLHPGFVATNFLRFLPPYIDGLKKWATSIFARTEYEGALTTVWAATHPSLEGKGGVYLDSCKEKTPNPLALNESLAEAFWKVSEEAIKGYVPENWASAMSEHDDEVEISAAAALSD